MTREEAKKAHAQHKKDVKEGFKKKGFNASDADDMADIFLSTKLTKGGTSKPVEKNKAIEPPKLKAKPEQKKTIPNTADQTTVFDWSEKVEGFESWPKMQLKTPVYTRKINSDAALSLRGVNIPLKKGDILLLNDKGFPYNFMTAEISERRLTQYSETVPKAYHEKTVAELTTKLERRERQAKTFAGEARKKKTKLKKTVVPTTNKTTKPATANNPKKPAPQNQPKNTPKKRMKCTREEGHAIRLADTFYHFLQENIWTKGLWKGKDVLKVVYTKGENAKYLVYT